MNDKEKLVLFCGIGVISTFMFYDIGSNFTIGLSYALGMFTIGYWVYIISKNIPKGDRKK